MRLPIVLVSALALAACDSGKKEDAGARAAGGEVLQGTISDAMIDLDQSTAEAPLAPRKAAKGEDKDAKKGADASGTAAEEEAPAAEVSPSAKPSAKAPTAAAAAD
jgi:hypothetical protein